MRTASVINYSKMERQAINAMFIREFKQKIEDLGIDKGVMCNTLVDNYYKSHTSKQFVWDVCRKQLVENLRKNREES